MENSLAKLHYSLDQKDEFCDMSHAYREGNACTDKLADYGVLISGFMWWDLIPNFLRSVFFHDMTGLPSQLGFIKMRGGFRTFV